MAHAVALNEYRSGSGLADFPVWNLRNPKAYSMHYGGFPLQSIGQSSVDMDGRVRIEMGFLGAHADIGGGYAPGQDQLSQVALHWMVAQATRAGVNMEAPDPLAMSAVLHDQSNNMLIGNPTEVRDGNRTDIRAYRLPQALRSNSPSGFARPEDREVRNAAGGTRQRQMVFAGRTAEGSRSMTNADTHEFIAYQQRSVDQYGKAKVGDSLRMDNNTGTVDITRYVDWLRKNNYCLWGMSCSVAQARPDF